jgi:hypothetical protein
MGNALFRHLLREILEVGQRIRFFLLFSREQKLLQFIVAHGGNFSIGDTEFLKLVDVSMGGRRRYLARSGYRPHAEIELEQQPCRFFQVSHGYSPPLFHKEGSVARRV